MSLSKEMGCVPVKLWCPWLILLLCVSVCGTCMASILATHDRNVVFPTFSSPSSRTVIVSVSIAGYILPEKEDYMYS